MPDETVTVKQRTFFTDYWRKILALALGLLTWLFISDRIGENIPVENVKVVINNRDSRLVLLSEDIHVTVNVKTSRQGNQFSSGDFLVEAEIQPDLNAEHMFNYNIDLKPSMVTKHPFFTRVVSIEPAAIGIKVDIKRDKSVPVRVFQTGSLRTGYTSIIKAKPDMVTINGRSELLKTITMVMTEELKLTESTAKFTQQLELQAPAPDVVITPRETSVTVDIVSIENRKEIQFKALPVRVLGGFPSVYACRSLKPLFVDVSMNGLPLNLNRVRRDELLPYIDLSEASQAGQVTAKVHLANYPADEVEASISPSSFEIELIAIPKTFWEPPAAVEEVPAGGVNAVDNGGENGGDNGGVKKVPLQNQVVKPAALPVKNGGG